MGGSLAGLGFAMQTSHPAEGKKHREGASGLSAFSVLLPASTPQPYLTLGAWYPYLFATTTLKIPETPDRRQRIRLAACSKGSQGGTTGLAVLASGGMFPRDLDPVCPLRVLGSLASLGSVPLERSEWRPALELIPGVVPAGDAGKPQRRPGNTRHFFLNQLAPLVAEQKVTVIAIKTHGKTPTGLDSKLKAVFRVVSRPLDIPAVTEKIHSCAAFCGLGGDSSLIECVVVSSATLGRSLLQRKDFNDRHSSPFPDPFPLSWSPAGLVDSQLTLLASLSSSSLEITPCLPANFPTLRPASRTSSFPSPAPLSPSSSLHSLATPLSLCNTPSSSLKLHAAPLTRIQDTDVPPTTFGLLFVLLRNTPSNSVSRNDFIAAQRSTCPAAQSTTASRRHIRDATLKRPIRPHQHV
ncbi:hypothetical protein BDP55DRAFT_626619 [Colletotrichum godetiae]|uniref:Uncharacterized protein n=1 Tax=Colletotrichum godetiae TaxID=1209918 RepID=A0AAJ0AXA2_9PEZI|nr:uncharacterized protein BDP55DRAFT_626619 [Colletotrichum godetiae]KAK1699948.1 hypothetical protein BDP55DRAFT_626619 [Colletotrichum godetiae]